MPAIKARDAELTHHLRNNHFPPATRRMIPACQLAIRAVRAGEPERGIRVGSRDHPGVVAAGDLVDDLRLRDFLDA